MGLFVPAKCNVVLHQRRRDLDMATQSEYSRASAEPREVTGRRSPETLAAFGQSKVLTMPLEDRAAAQPG